MTQLNNQSVMDHIANFLSIPSTKNIYEEELELQSQEIKIEITFTKKRLWSVKLFDYYGDEEPFVSEQLNDALKKAFVDYHSIWVNSCKKLDHSDPTYNRTCRYVRDQLSKMIRTWPKEKPTPL